MKKTIIDLFESSVLKKCGKKTFLLEKRHHAFQPTTYAETREQALEVGAGLASLGIRPKDKVAILAEGSNGWIISELGIFYAGAISVPLSVELRRVERSVVPAPPRRGQGAVRFETTASEDPPHPGGTAGTRTRTSSSWDTFRSKAARRPTACSNVWAATIWPGIRRNFFKTGQAIRNDDYATITYTSGTTADPKGVVLTHRNYTANVEQSLSRIDIPSSYRTLIILPLDHCFAHVVGFTS